MDSWLVFRRNRVILNQWTKRNDRSIKWFSKTSLAWSFPIRQEILDMSQIAMAFHRIGPPPFIQSWLYQYSAEVPSFTRRTALSAMPFISDRWGVEVRWFHDKTFTCFPKFHCPYKQLSVCAAPRILTNFSPSHFSILKNVCCCLVLHLLRIRPTSFALDHSPCARMIWILTKGLILWRC